MFGISLASFTFSSSDCFRDPWNSRTAGRTSRSSVPFLSLSLTSRRRGLRVLLLLALPVLFEGCTTWYLARPGTLGAAKVFVSPDQRLPLWRRAVVVLLDQGYVPQVLNESACFISARRREDIANDAFARTIALFSVSPEGLVRMEISGAGLFRSEESFVAAVHDRQESLLSLILGSPENPATAH